VAEQFFVYVLRSDTTGRRYVGSCQDLQDRLRRHNAGESKSTCHGVPWTVIHQEAFASRVEAVQRDRYFKSGRGRDELDRIESIQVEPFLSIAEIESLRQQNRTGKPLEEILGRLGF
jgi:putative endonuclease